MRYVVSIIIKFRKFLCATAATFLFSFYYMVMLSVCFVGFCFFQRYFLPTPSIIWVKEYTKYYYFPTGNYIK